MYVYNLKSNLVAVHLLKTPCLYKDLDYTYRLMKAR